MRVNTFGKDPASLGESQFKEPKPGKYHVTINNIEVCPEKHSNCIVIDLEILDGSIPGQAKIKTKWFLWYDPQAEKWNESCEERVARFFWAAGLLGDEPQADVNPSDAINRQMIVEFAKSIDKKTGKERTGVTDAGCWPLGHKEVADVPVSTAAIEYAKQQAAAPAKAPSDATDDSLPGDDLLAGL